MAVATLVGRDVVEEQRRHAGAMQIAEVIELEEGVDHQLPVHAWPDRRDAVDLPTRHVPRLEVGLHRAEERIDVEIGALAFFQSRRYDPDHAATLRHRELPEAMRAAIEIAEPGAVGDADELAC